MTMFPPTSTRDSYSQWTQQGSILRKTMNKTQYLPPIKLATETPGCELSDDDVELDILPPH
jgi:hypothetical protein